MIKEGGLQLHRPDYVRDLVFGDVLKKVTLPKEYITQKIPHGYQDGVPACVRYSFDYLAQKQELKSEKKIFEFNSDLGYAWIKIFLDKNRNWGTTLLNGAKASVNPGSFESALTGLIDYKNLYRSDKDKFFDPNQFTKEMLENAKIFSRQLYIRGNYVGWGTVKEDELKQMIVQREGAVIAIRLDHMFHKGCYDGSGISLPPLPTSKVVHHAICVDSYKIINGDLYFRYANWSSKSPSIKEDTYSYGWLNWRLWRPHIWANYKQIL